MEHDISYHLAGFLSGCKDFDCKVSALPEDKWGGASITAEECSDIYVCMQGCDIVLLMANSKLELITNISNEIQVAQKGFQYPMPILAVKTEVVEGVSPVVKEAAKEVVEWDAEAIVKAIKSHASS